MTTKTSTRRAPKLTRAESRKRNRDFYTWFILPFIGRAIEMAGLTGDDAQSAALGEIDDDKELRHLLAAGPARRRGR